ncbi:hypothetical protein AB0E01_43665 [Nocardia vinacea]|uniref:hypothetical protein n=1 Tax=Nocardia vinacea TaxID=96468 RepID=UPI0033EC3711
MATPMAAAPAATVTPAAARGQSTQVYLRALLERELRAERNKHLLESLTGHRSLGISAEDVVEEIRGGREDDE